ncbi:hypothetical protein A3H10_04375 [Candidatus Uhrbacteria bacterium RIFCSPLOWO2_12_FULL_46_10]|uniref:Methyltransferase type 11 domain-containing protein n=1 Tax=Candidatus Uhrbacteria bacterium RIFCSPLOWO2_01_FULL_47_25 TaxID=1802402 RepID=A0A1F7UXT2_9BACT|nr:MAG: putative SAM-dependent methyltransferase [Parcubacteria group bacterium GW2011_GWA2_46_9]OGL59771.1 MAG: hypothetical protein A2752_03220 [Candidatus Uhrbacteria bacterium RIFCSPHIGHO2_01_FULL_46_23]OGL70567.1 MAG: hypothetical protein A3D60_03790 [Candidatus Uhrbacteria bacterium RIFCSPHIGHO2_02_FULL_47_29]OGL75823.1 MAG: hypothetical protein A3E96_02730 [Candidatus Uhrbacteria bacterium RIFCSPHIGHO2_12_FULL_46_13]OGL83100.1 MAG: hypothetical protein A2936_05295 [Candidatus Uhrbacteria
MSIVSGESILLDAEKILSHLKIGEGMRVGELGCGGRGHFVFPAVRLVGTKGRVYAVDILKACLTAIEHQATEEHWPHVMTVWSNLEIVGATKIPNGELDRATLINILFQVHDLSAIFTEARRLLKREGLLLVIDWSGASSPFGPSADRRIMPEKTIALAERVGFRSVEQFKAGPHHYGIIFQAC